MGSDQPFSYRASEFLARELANTRKPRSFEAGDRVLCWLIVFIAAEIISCFSFLVSLDIDFYFLSDSDAMLISMVSVGEIMQSNVGQYRARPERRRYRQLKMWPMCGGYV